jgi:FixJ family two-component response regulator
MNFIPSRPHGAAPKLTESPIVFIVDQEDSMRDGLEAVIRTAGLQTIASASAEEFLAQPSITAPCCLLIEQHLRGSSGFDLQDVLSGRADLPIIFMSRYADVAATVRAMKAGALEFLTKPFRNDVLLGAIELAIARSRAALRDLAQLRELEGRYESLSRREREVMSGVVSGRLNKQIGGDLGISEITVKAHRGSVMRKMQAGSLARLVRMAANLQPVAPANLRDRTAAAQVIQPRPPAVKEPIATFAVSRASVPAGTRYFRVTVGDTTFS